MGKVSSISLTDKIGADLNPICRFLDKFRCQYLICPGLVVTKCQTVEMNIRFSKNNLKLSTGIIFNILSNRWNWGGFELGFPAFLTTVDVNT